MRQIRIWAVAYACIYAALVGCAKKKSSPLEWSNLAFKDNIRSIAIQPDGKIVIAGTNAKGFFFRRYDSTGAIDSSFGTSGQVHVTGFPPCREADGIENYYDSADLMDFTLQADGKLLATGYGAFSAYFAGGGYWYTSCLILARLNSNGSLDTSFGEGGKVTESFPGRGTFPATQTGERVRVQSTGKVIVLGAGVIGEGVPAQYFGRFNSNGSLDTTFANSGMRPSPAYVQGSGQNYMSMELQSDDKIILFTVNGSDPCCRFQLYRFDANGATDTSFGTAGIVDVGTTLAMYWVPTQMGIRSDGKIVVGYRANSNDITVKLFDSNGIQDSSFGSGGQTTVTSSYHVWKMNVLPDNTIAINFRQKFHLLNSDGSIPTAFGSNGVFSREDDDPLFFSNVALAGDGNYIAVGVEPDSDTKHYMHPTESPIIFGVMKILSDGSGLDTGFGTQGVSKSVP